MPCGTMLLGYGVDLIPINDADTLRATEQVDNSPSFQSLLRLWNDTDVT